MCVYVLYVSGSPTAQPYTIKQAKCLAMTAIDVMCDPKQLADIKEDFECAMASANK